MTTTWLYHRATERWRRVTLRQRPYGLICRVDGQVLNLVPVQDEDGATHGAAGWLWHPRQTPPCRVCGDVIAFHGQGHSVTDDVCARHQVNGGADPAADFTARRIELRERRAA